MKGELKRLTVKAIIYRLIAVAGEAALAYIYGGFVIAGVTGTLLGFILFNNLIKAGIYLLYDVLWTPSTGIRFGYPRIRRRVGVFAAYLQLIRPLTMVAPLIGGFAGGLMAYKATFGSVPTLPDSAWLPIVYGTVNLLLIQAGNNVLNQAAESELDAKVKPYRPIPRGVVKREEAFSLSFMLYALASFRSAVINETFGVIVLFIMLLTISYSLPPLYFKSRLWLGNLNLGLARGGLGFMAAYSIYGDPFQPLPLSIALVLGVYVFGANSTKDFADREGDASFGIRTLVTVYGNRSRLIIAPFFLAPYPLILLFIYLSYMPSMFIWMLLLLPLSVYAVYVLVRQPDRELSISENTLSWLIFYSLLGALFLGFALLFAFFTWS